MASASKPSNKLAGRDHETQRRSGCGLRRTVRVRSNQDRRKPNGATTVTGRKSPRYISRRTLLLSRIYVFPTNCGKGYSRKGKEIVRRNGSETISRLRQSILGRRIPAPSTASTLGSRH